MSLTINASTYAAPTSQRFRQPSEISFASVMDARQASPDAVPGKLNRMLSSQEKSYIHQHWNLDNLEQKEAADLISYLEKNSIINSASHLEENPFSSNDHLYNAGPSLAANTAYAFETGIKMFSLMPQKNDDCFTALSKIVEINDQLNKGMAVDKKELPEVLEHRSYQKELLKSLTVIYKDMGAASTIAKAKASIEHVYELGRVEYSSAMSQYSQTAGQSFPELEGAVPAINELIRQSLKSVSDQWLESRGMTMSEWTSILDRQKEDTEKRMSSL